MVKVPLDLNEAFVDRHAETDPLTGAPIADPVLSGMSNAVKLAREQATVLANFEAAALADRTQTPEANLLRIANAAGKTGKRVAVQLDAARTRAKTEIANIQKRTGSPPPPKDSLALAMEAEIRARLANMLPKDRAAAIAKAKAENNETIIAAVLRGPAMLVGMGEAEQNAIKHHYRMRFHAADYARLERLNKAVDAMERPGRLFVSLVRSAEDSPSARLAAINTRAVEEAAAAHAREA
ncbi:hypothetical protein D3227_15590 [Mesorhizobium waimense]|uniref:Uncharacterized protein n=2 Tax=Mesorhizobium waimense TaxID=1300307 RepID=A0A3A5KRK1_9HYPH|nr:hypothetical protein D3227_15590 [Mesorhizobium waimense]